MAIVLPTSLSNLVPSYPPDPTQLVSVKRFELGVKVDESKSSLLNDNHDKATCDNDEFTEMECHSVKISDESDLQGDSSQQMYLDSDDDYEDDRVDGEGRRSHNITTAELPWLKVLVQRFMEDKQFGGRRTDADVGSRCMIRSLLQVPAIKDDFVKTKAREDRDGVEMMVILLKELYLGLNDFKGMIPQDIGNLSLLEVLIIPAASLTGNIPSSLFNISSLKYVYLYNNSLSGNIPSNMCDSLPNIEVLSLWTNQLSGEIPPNIWKCTHLQDLELSVNHFNGKIPSEIGSLSMLRDLWLGYNDFRVIPEEIGNLSQLETLSIPASSLTGNIPSSVLNISSLKFIDLSNNTLSGNIPTFHHLPKLEELYLFHNNFEGWLPSDVCSSNMSNIKTLELYGNQLQGPIPPNIWKCTHLEILALSDNNLSGNIPFEIGNMSMLKELYLSGNNFQGGIPAEIGKLTPLEVIDLANASLTGNIPTSIFNISTLTKLSLGYNNLSGKY
ncbi:hypothetical protein SASPL_150143 [Salvia splendens]|uniref:non-specific serine/threonine protein kinase n=1 Tax=Salvia splendens TaxID=180675 RepID=A0A8X8W6X3_SALSN|nr:hypothetical protein SASPL_150143 [Salvia splendens]